MNAVAVTESDVMVKTPDGTADCYYVHPANGSAPAVLVWPDIFGLRPAFRQMGKRLAETGFAVLVVNPFYRVKKAPTADAGAKTPIPELRPLAQALNERLASLQVVVLVREHRLGGHEAQVGQAEVVLAHVAGTLDDFARFGIRARRTLFAALPSAPHRAKRGGAARASLA